MRLFSIIEKKAGAKNYYQANKKTLKKDRKSVLVILLKNV